MIFEWIYDSGFKNKEIIAWRRKKNRAILAQQAGVVEWYTRTTQNRVTKNHGGSNPLSATNNLN